MLILFGACSSSGVLENAGSGTGTDPISGITEKEADKQYLSTEAESEYDMNGDNIYIYYTVNSSAAGYIDGETKQQITDINGRTSMIKAVPNLGYKFVCWSDGNTNVSRVRDTADASTVFIAIFDYDVLEMPLISITTETGSDVTSKTTYINATFNIYYAGSEKYELADVNAGIRGRGNNTWGYEKKSYKLDLNKKENLFGIGSGESKKWVLLANVCDQSLLRNHAAFEFMRGFGGIKFAPASISVEVYLNGEYRGVYLLAEEINVDANRVAVDEDNTEKSVDIGYLIEMTYNAAGTTFSAADRVFQVHNDLSEDSVLSGKQLSYISDYVQQCLDAVKVGDR
jgi:hypothetical protein